MGSPNPKLFGHLEKLLSGILNVIENEIFICIFIPDDL